MSKSQEDNEVKHGDSSFHNDNSHEATDEEDLVGGGDEGRGVGTDAKDENVRDDKDDKDSKIDTILEDYTETRDPTGKATLSCNLCNKKEIVEDLWS